MGRRNEESREQQELLKWWRLQAPPVLRPLLFAIPNGGRRDAITGARLKAEGVRAGVPDLFLAVVTRLYGGLFIEMKRRDGGRLSPHQRDMMLALSGRGYAVAVCKGWNEAKCEIERYLGWDKAQAARTLPGMGQEPSRQGTAKTVGKATAQKASARPEKGTAQEDEANTLPWEKWRFKDERDGE